MRKLLPSSHPVVVVVLSYLLLLSTRYRTSAANAARAARHPRPTAPRTPSDIDEVTATLLSSHDDPFATLDKWPTIPISLRRRWADTNTRYAPHAPLSTLLTVARTLRESPTPLHVDIHIVAPQSILTPPRKRSILHYATAMRAHANETDIHFSVSIASPHLFTRIAMHPQSTHPTSFTSLLDTAATSSGSLNILYVIINTPSHPVTDYIAPIPFLGAARAALFVYTPPSDTNQIVIPALLSATERAAQRVFAPFPLYAPIPCTHELLVHIIAYSPRHDPAIRPAWVAAFSWERFEEAVRAHVLPKHIVRFMSWQTNAECKLCRLAFRDIERQPGDNFAEQAVRILNGNVMPVRTLASSASASNVASKSDSSSSTIAGGGVDSSGFTTFKDGAGGNSGTAKSARSNTVRVYVLDTSNLPRIDAVTRLERKRIFIYAGITLIIVRASEPASARLLPVLMLRAAIACAYGIADPALYIPVARRADGVAVSDDVAGTNSEDSASGIDTAAAVRPSPVLWDIATRSVVCGMIERSLDELMEIIDGMVYFEVDPAQALDKSEYDAFVQRVNLLLFKVERAQRALAEGGDDFATAVYLAAATEHDLREVRAAFDIDDEKRISKRFRDPTVRCHFSRLKREALRASEILETTYPSVMPVAVAVLSFWISLTVSRAVLLKMASRKSAGKQE